MLALVSLALFVRYIHHIVHSIRAVSVLGAVGDETRESLEKLYPDQIGRVAPPDLARRQLPSQVRVDGNGKLRVIARRMSWDDYVSLAFDEIRLYSGRSLQVVRRLRGALTDLLEDAPPSRRAALAPQLKLLDRDLTREFDDPLDQLTARRPANVS